MQIANIIGQASNIEGGHVDGDACSGLTGINELLDLLNKVCSHAAANLVVLCAPKGLLAVRLKPALHIRCHLACCTLLHYAVNMSVKHT